MRWKWISHIPGFTIPNKFVFGYGLDLDEYYRNLNFIGVVDLDKYVTPSDDEGKMIFEI